MHFNSFVAERVPAQLLVCCAGGRIWSGQTVNEWIEAFVVSKGRIVATGKRSDMEAFCTTATKRLEVPTGQLLLPGMIDAHLHLAMGGASMRTLQLDGVSSREMFEQKVLDWSEKLKPGQWLLGGGWDQSLWGGELPTKDWLNHIRQDIPVWLRRVDGHMGLANQTALQKSDVNENTAIPTGGKILRDEFGKANGILMDTAMDLMLQPKPTSHQFNQDLERAAAHLASLGITTAHDMWTTMEDLSMVIEKWQEPMPIRLRVAVPLSEQVEHAKFIEQHGNGTPLISWNMSKVFIDGSLGSKTALMLNDYRGNSGGRGVLVTGREELLKQLEHLNNKKIIVLIHAIGDAAVRLALDVIEQLRAQGMDESLVRIEHAQHIHPSDIPRFKSNQVMASIQPIHLTDDARSIEQLLEQKELVNAFPWQSQVSAGSQLALGTDWPIANPSPWLNIHAAVTRQSNDGNNPDGWFPDQALRLRQALSFYTTGSALAANEANELGVLAPDYWADFTILDTDIFDGDVSSLLTVKCLATWVAGCLSYKLHQGENVQ